MANREPDDNPMIPEPDYNEDVRPGHYNGNNRRRNDSDNNNDLSNTTVSVDEDGLIIPRKPMNPTKESMEYRALHKELKFCQKTGKNPLNQKSELHKHLQKHTQNKNRREKETELNVSNTELGKTLEMRARRLEELMKGPEGESRNNTGEPNEFLRMHAKLRGRVERTSAHP